MNEHEALVERVAKALYGCGDRHDGCLHRVEQTLDAILDGNTLIVGTRIGDGLVRGEHIVRVGLVGSLDQWALTPITDTDPARG